MCYKKPLIGCIADDFTGASDVCSFLVDTGAKCILFNGIPSNNFDLSQYDVIVIALKIRNIHKKEAIAEVEKAYNFFVANGIEKIYDKYCSTFDSTKEGNIGPILDFLLEKSGQNFTIVSPALPENNRIVFNGYLFADNVLLEDSSMRNHPLNPMKDSYIPRLLESQSKHRCFMLNYLDLKDSPEKILIKSDSFSKNKNYYICCDYICNEHGAKIAETFKNLNLLSGSSSLIKEWYKALNPNAQNNINTTIIKDTSPTLILSGSLSTQTKKQINAYIKTGSKTLRLYPDKLISKEQTIEELYKHIDNMENDLLIYSSGEETVNRTIQKQYSEILELTVSQLGLYALKSGINKLIVAGGETSGAVTKSLNYIAFDIGKTVAPGIPILKPINETNKQLILKSGNFGQDDFFNKAIAMMGGSL